MAKLLDSETERQALLAILDRPGDVRLSLLADLTNEHFFYPASQEIWRRIVALARTAEGGVQYLPNSHVMAQDVALGQEARNFLLGAQTTVQTVDDARAMIEALKYWSRLRYLYEGANEFTRVLTGNQVTLADLETAEGALERALTGSRGMATKGYSRISIGHGGELPGYAKKLRNMSPDKPRLIPTGLREFDERVGGWGRGNLVILASTTSGGKTTLAQTLGVNQYYLGWTVGTLSMEMTEDEFQNRIYSRLASVPLEIINKHPTPQMTEEQLRLIEQAEHNFASVGQQLGCRWELISGSFLGSEQAQGLLAPLDLDIVYIDYINLFTDVQDNPGEMWHWLGKVAKVYKHFAKAHDCVVVLLAQLDEKTKAIRYSRMIKEHCDWMWGWTYGDEQAATHMVEIEMPKARHGPRFKFKLVEIFPYGCFRDYQAVDQPQAVQSSIPTSMAPLC